MTGVLSSGVPWLLCPLRMWAAPPTGPGRQWLKGTRAHQGRCLLQPAALTPPVLGAYAGPVLCLSCVQRVALQVPSSTACPRWTEPLEQTTLPVAADRGSVCAAWLFPSTHPGWVTGPAVGSFACRRHAARLRKTGGPSLSPPEQRMMSFVAGDSEEPSSIWTLSLQTSEKPCCFWWPGVSHRRWLLLPDLAIPVPLPQAPPSPAPGDFLWVVKGTLGHRLRTVGWGAHRGACRLCR